MDILKELFSLKDEKYKEFHKKLIPNVNSDLIIGVRTPLVKKLAKMVIKEGDDALFLSKLPHKYYEENNLHAFLINEMKDYDKCIKMLDEFLPHVDNWATCDGIRPKCFKNNTDKLIFDIKRWLKSNEEYTIRFALEMIMVFYLDKNFDEKYLKMASKIKSDKYYINMMISWLFATSLAKQYEKTLPYLEEKNLPIWVHNKTIQKAIESFRISDDDKKYLRTLKVKIK
ncbi:MAG: DNA alkylation repair protein [Ruminococcaceae bacterium]|nr:DNA alkylation repair protein [Oscillospiraceae bacterium]